MRRGGHVGRIGRWAVLFGISAAPRGSFLDPVAINDIDFAAVELCGVFGTHLPMREANATGDVASGVCIGGAGVDHDDVGNSDFEINGQIP